MVTLTWCHSYFAIFWFSESGSLRSMMSRDSRPPFGLDSLTALSKPSASGPKLFNSLLLGSSMAQSKPEGSSLRDLLNSGPGRLPQGPGESGVPFPSVFTSAGVSVKLLSLLLWNFPKCINLNKKKIEGKISFLLCLCFFCFVSILITLWYNVEWYRTFT